MPTLVDFGFSEEEIKKPKEAKGYFDYKGGEDAALKRCKEYIFGTKSVGQYAATRNDLIGDSYSSRLSAWLACGAISPRYIYF